MPLLLDKVVGLILSPLGVGLAAIVAGIVALARGRRRAALVAACGAMAWLWVWSMPMVAQALHRSLAAPYPPQRAEALPAADAIVLLGGGITPTKAGHPYPNLGSGADRIWHAARLYHAGKAPVIVASAGSIWGERAWGGPEAETGAAAMRTALLAWGVPSAAILMEERSRSTRGNAVQTARLAAHRGLRRLLLVTSAWHMPRAEAAFERVGLRVTPAPCDHHSVASSPGLIQLLPSASALAGSSRILRERLGLWAYRLRGWA